MTHNDSINKTIDNEYSDFFEYERKINDFINKPKINQEEDNILCGFRMFFNNIFELPHSEEDYNETCKREINDDDFDMDIVDRWGYELELFDKNSLEIKPNTKCCRKCSANYNFCILCNKHFVDGGGCFTLL